MANSAQIIVLKNNLDNAQSKQFQVNPTLTPRTTALHGHLLRFLDEKQKVGKTKRHQFLNILTGGLNTINKDRCKETTDFLFIYLFIQLFIWRKD